jgi:hypothetical protein
LPFSDKCGSKRLTVLVKKKGTYSIEQKIVLGICLGRLNFLKA